MSKAWTITPLRIRPKAGIPALLVMLFLLPLLVRNPFHLHILIIMAINIITASALRLLLITGRFNIGIMAFSALGAYTSALLTLKMGVNFWLAIIAGGILAAIVAITLGYIVLRISGVYFAIMTMCLLEMLRHFLIWYRELTGGVMGLLNIPGPIVGGFEFGINKVAYYYLALTIMLFSVWLMYRIECSRVGIAFHNIGQSDLLSEHLGINLTRYRVLAFAISSFFAAIAGSIGTHYLHITSPEDFTVMQSITIQIFLVIGGRGSPLGPIIGVIVLTVLSEMLRIAKEIQPIIYGAFLIPIILFFPRGLVSLPEVISKWRCHKHNHGFR